MVAASMSSLGSPARRHAAKTALLVVLLGPLVTSCGQATQDAHESKAQYTIKVVRASFPAKQAVARPVALELDLLNESTTTVPNVAVTVVSFYYHSEFPNLAEHARPIWIVDQGPGAIPQRPVETVLNSPGGNLTATANTWAAGPLASGEERTFKWMLTPVKAGNHTLAYAVAAGLHGKASARLPGGGPVAGRFSVEVAAAPPVNHVNPETGNVEPGPNPVAPGP
jgi:hypothetical protein